MSEVIVVSPGSSPTGPVLGLNIINEARLEVTRQTPTSPVVTTGSPGQDSIRVANLADARVYQLSGGANDDDIAGAAGNDQLSGDGNNDVILGRGGNDRISGGEGSDILYGGTGDDIINGDAGIDLVNAGAGDDVVNGGDGNDTLLGGPGNDELFGGSGEDVLRGGAGDDTLAGGAGGDDLRGGDGDDILIPGPGGDIVRSGSGNDTFIFGAGSLGTGPIDQLLDFNPTADRIELSRTLLPGASLSTGTISSENFAVVGNISGAAVTAALVYERSTGIVYYNPETGRNVPLFQMRSGLINISAENFTIIT